MLLVKTDGSMYRFPGQRRRGAPRPPPPSQSPFSLRPFAVASSRGFLYAHCDFQLFFAKMITTAAMKSNGLSAAAAATACVVLLYCIVYLGTDTKRTNERRARENNVESRAWLPDLVSGWMGSVRDAPLFFEVLLLATYPIYLLTKSEGG